MANERGPETGQGKRRSTLSSRAMASFVHLTGIGGTALSNDGVQQLGELLEGLQKTPDREQLVRALRTAVHHSNALQAWVATGCVTSLISDGSSSEGDVLGNVDESPGAPVVAAKSVESSIPTDLSLPPGERWETLMPEPSRPAAPVVSAVSARLDEPNENPFGRGPQDAHIAIGNPIGVPDDFFRVDREALVSWGIIDSLDSSRTAIVSAYKWLNRPVFDRFPRTPRANQDDPSVRGWIECMKRAKALRDDLGIKRVHDLVRYARSRAFVDPAPELKGCIEDLRLVLEEMAQRSPDIAFVLRPVHPKAMEYNAAHDWGRYNIDPNQAVSADSVYSVQFANRFNEAFRPLGLENCPTRLDLTRLIATFGLGSFMKGGPFHLRRSGPGNAKAVAGSYRGPRSR